MANRLWQTAIDRAGMLVEPLARNELADIELLRRFVAERDESAFAALVRRHGPLVWSVCRSLLPGEADAEDCFQATFLVLVRSARRVSKPQALGAWLHTVAGRVCRNSLRALARRRKHERGAATLEADRPIDAATWDRWQAAAHDEIARLPEALRIPFVMCILQGVRQPDAAAQLGWKLGTLSSRLCKAKQALAESLARRGVAAGVVTALGGATMPISAALNGKGVDTIRHGVGPGGQHSQLINDLARGAMGGMMGKTKLMATALAIGVIAVGIGSHVLSRADAQSAPPAIGGGARTGPAAGAGAPPGGYPGAPPAGLSGGSGIASGPILPKVEYLFVANPKQTDGFKTLLTKRGAEGWEYVGVIPGQDELIFKRRAQPLSGGMMGPGMSGMGGGIAAPPSGSGPIPGKGPPPRIPGTPGGPGGPGGAADVPGLPSVPRLPGTGLGEGGSRPAVPGASGIGGLGGAGEGGSSLEVNIKVGETIRHPMSIQHQIDRIHVSAVDAKFVDVTPDPTNASRVLIKGLTAGSAKLTLTDPLGVAETFLIRVK